MGVGWAQLSPAAARERDSPPAALQREQEAGEEGENEGLARKEGREGDPRGLSSPQRETPAGGGCRGYRGPKEQVLFLFPLAVCRRRAQLVII